MSHHSGTPATSTFSTAREMLPRMEGSGYRSTNSTCLHVGQAPQLLLVLTTHPPLGYHCQPRGADQW